MKNRYLQNILENRLYSFGIALLFTGFAGLVAFQFNPNSTIPTLGVSLAIFRELIGYVKDRLIKSQDKADKADILKKFAFNQIKLIRTACDNQNISSTVSCLSNLEYILIQIKDCCNTKPLNLKFEEALTVVSITKMTLETSKFDKRLKKPFRDAIGCISKIETYLNEL